MPPSPWFDSSDISTFRTGLVSMLSPDPANQKMVFLAIHRSLKWTPARDPVVCILSITNRPSIQFFMVERGGPVCGRSVVGPTALEKLQDFKVLKWIQDFDHKNQVFFLLPVHIPYPPERERYGDGNHSINS